jgi:prepilin-type N-terminal cleavage/methylation domain-containing protein
MLRRVRERLAQGDGFTLIELLVVILIIGILSAIFLPQFFVHRDRAEDADAKTAARNLSTEVESCYLVQQDVTLCDSAAELGTTGLSIGNAPGQVFVSDSDVGSYEVTAVSKGNIGGTHHFYLRRASMGSAAERDCDPPGKGGCAQDGKW